MPPDDTGSVGGRVAGCQQRDRETRDGARRWHSSRRELDIADTPLQHRAMIAAAVGQH